MSHLAGLKTLSKEGSKSVQRLDEYSKKSWINNWLWPVQGWEEFLPGAQAFLRGLLPELTWGRVSWPVTSRLRNGQTRRPPQPEGKTSRCPAWNSSLVTIVSCVRYFPVPVAKLVGLVLSKMISGRKRPANTIRGNFPLSKLINFPEMNFSGHDKRTSSHFKLQPGTMKKVNFSDGNVSELFSLAIHWLFSWKSIVSEKCRNRIQ